MPDLTAKRTLVKSPPELWEELSEVEGLAKHLGAFGEIKITKLEPEHTVAWEGEHASGTVSIEPSGWGTKVTLRAELPEEEPPAPEEPVAEAPGVEEPVEEEPAAEAEEVGAEAEEPAAEAEEVSAEAEEPAAEQPEVLEEELEPPAKRRGFWAWLFRPRTAAREPGRFAVEAEPVPGPEPEPEEPVAEEPEPHVGEPEVEEPVAEEPVAEEPEPHVGEPEVEEPAVEEPHVEEPELVDSERARAILDEALDALGAAHHRPFSRG